MINRENLRREMFAKNISFAILAKELNITVQTLYNKISGKTEFTEKEIIILIGLFGRVILANENY